VLVNDRLRAESICPATFTFDPKRQFDMNVLSAPSRKCMNSAGLIMLPIRRSFFFASLVSDCLLRFNSRHFKDLHGIWQSRPGAK